MPTETKKSSKKITTPKLLRGFKDVLPEDEKYWDRVMTVTARIAREYGYGYIHTPIVEDVAVFERTVGASSDIVSKELFRFNLQKGEERDDIGQDVALRPEMTASIMRAYIEHGMHNRPQPLKLWSSGALFRYDRPQAGRYRQFNQFDFEIIGDASPVIDAQVIIMTHQIYKELGLDVVFPVNSIGDLESRQAYIAALKEYLTPKMRGIDAELKKQIRANPLRVFDMKDEAIQALLDDAPQILDYLSEECRNHFVSVLEYLDEVDVPYELNPRLVRGLDYYTHTVFEVFLRSDLEKQEGRVNALGGGGRYNGLSEVLGGRETPGCGFAAGIERTVLALKSEGITVPRVNQKDIFVAQLGDKARHKALQLFETLRSNGWSVAESFSKDGLSNQLERANKLGVQLTLILGQKEILDGTIIVRDMGSGIQEEINYDKLLAELERRVDKDRVVVEIEPDEKESEEEASDGSAHAHVDTPNEESSEAPKKDEAEQGTIFDNSSNEDNERKEVDTD